MGILTRPCPLLNYSLLIAKVYLWDCRRNQTFPNIIGFKAKIELKYETEAYIARKGIKIKTLTVVMGELYSVILLSFLLLLYVYRISILFFGHLNNYFLQTFFAKLVVVIYVTYVNDNSYVNVGRSCLLMTLKSCFIS